MFRSARPRLMCASAGALGGYLRYAHAGIGERFVKLAFGRGGRFFVERAIRPVSDLLRREEQLDPFALRSKALSVIAWR